MSELDFTQKLEMRRAFWAGGASTRVDVKLGALVERNRSKTRAGSEDWTDLDVLAVDYSPVHGASFTVADCKTVRGRATERVFWLRGVADLFDARAAFLTRDGDIPASTRQLALRLDIAALDSADRRVLAEQLGSDSLPAAGTFLEGATLTRWMKLTADVPQSVDRLQRYRQTYYWLQRPRRNLTALPTALGRSAAAFVPEQRWALALVTDLAWLYLVATLGALDDITRLQLSDIPRGLVQAVFGGEQERREKERLAEQLRTLIAHIDSRSAAQVENLPILPAYFDDLVDLVTRISRRRTYVNGALRALEFVGVETIGSKGARWTEAFPKASPLEAKLASDVVRFLCKACGLATEFVDAFDAATNGVEGTDLPRDVEQDRSAELLGRPRIKGPRAQSTRTSIARDNEPDQTSLFADARPEGSESDRVTSLGADSRDADSSEGA